MLDQQLDGEDNGLREVLPMTEEEWLACRKPGHLLIHLHARPNPRKERLFACACCRHVWQLLSDPRSRRAVEVSERFADGLATIAELTAARIAAKTALAERGYANLDPGSCVALAALTSVDGKTGAAHSVRRAFGRKGDPLCLIEQDYQCQVIRDIFGNPFRPVTLDPAWLTANVVGLAQSIYDERAFDRLPILADALEDAGCTNADLLAHCRSQQEHARGCWAVDLLLGKQ
jgi:hypothetical protein